MPLFLVGVIGAIIFAKLFGTWALGAVVGSIQGALAGLFCYFIGCLILPDTIANLETLRLFVGCSAALGAVTGAIEAA